MDTAKVFWSGRSQAVRLPRAFRVAAIAALGTAIAACLWTGFWSIPLGAQGQRFQSRVAIVPVDVRVVDRNGAPVHDLARADFVVLEVLARCSPSGRAVMALSAFAPKPFCRDES